MADNPEVGGLNPTAGGRYCFGEQLKYVSQFIELDACILHLDYGSKPGNDFSRASNWLYSIIFADDTSVFWQGTYYDNIIATLNDGLKKISIWLKANKLTMNINKTHYMMFHRTKIEYSTKTINIDYSIINWNGLITSSI